MAAEEIGVDVNKSVSVASQKKRGVFRRIIRGNPQYLAEMGYHGLYVTGTNLELHSTEELVRIEMGRVIVPVIGDIVQPARGLNPSHSVRPRKDLRKPRRGRKSRRGARK